MKIKLTKKSNLLISILFLLSSNLLAQNFKAKFTLGKVAQDGMHKVLLRPELRSVASQNLSDLRFSTSQDSLVETPYLLHSDNSPLTHEIFSPLSWKETTKKGLNNFLVQTKGENICGLYLKVANHTNERRFSISGSNNNKNWYSISDLEILNPTFDESQTYYWKRIQFPKVNYKYISLTFLDSSQLSIKILAIGELYKETTIFEPTPIVDLKFIKEELASQKITRLKVFGVNPQQINELQFLIQSPTYYLREARVYLKRKINPKRGPSYWEEENIGSFNIKYGTNNTFQWSHYISDTIFIDINNKDNPPLQIENVLFKQNPIFLYAFCKAGQSPAIFVGDSLLQAAQYDLAAFSDEILQSTALVLEIQEMQIIDIKSSSKIEKGFWQDELFLWICMGVGALSVFFFSLKLLNNKE